MLPAVSGASWNDADRGFTSTTAQTAVRSHDTILSSLASLRSNPTLSEPVANVMASYEQQAKLQATQGKAPHHRSGRYNTIDAYSSLPELCSPNEGFYGSYKKETPYL